MKDKIKNKNKLFFVISKVNENSEDGIKYRFMDFCGLETKNLKFEGER